MPREYNVKENIAIKIEHVSKKYCKSLKRSMLYGVQDIGRNTIGLSSRSDRLRKKEFWAVDDVSFEVRKGETLGIIGPNGSGKTTLLKMLNGIFWPDKGKITVRGRVGALIEVGAGFHPLLTGRENIYVNAAIMGMTKQEVDEKFDTIVQFADIDDFIDSPVKFYSSGMFVRLGFAVAVHCDPDILLVDEVLAVGDISFQSKCLNKIGEMREKEVTTIMVSHRMPAISGFCQQALYLNHGKLKYVGRVDRAIELHKRDSSYKEELEDFKFAPEDVKGSGLIRFTKIQFLDEDENSVTEIKAYSPLILRIHYYSEGYTGKVELSIAIRDQNEGMFFNATNESYSRELVIPKKSGYFDIFFKNICANNQRLLFYITLWKHRRKELFDWKRELPLYVIGSSLSHGNILLDVEWKVT